MSRQTRHLHVNCASFLDVNIGAAVELRVGLSLRCEGERERVVAPASGRLSRLHLIDDLIGGRRSCEIR